MKKVVFYLVVFGIIESSSCAAQAIDDNFPDSIKKTLKLVNVYKYRLNSQSK